MLGFRFRVLGAKSLGERCSLHMHSLVVSLCTYSDGFVRTTHCTTVACWSHILRRLGALNPKQS